MVDDPEDGINTVDVGELSKSTPTRKSAGILSDIDFNGLAEAATTLLVSFVYHNSDEAGKLSTLLDLESEVQNGYIDDGMYKAAIMRQAAFIEYFSIAHLTARFEELKGKSLSNTEIDFLEDRLGHSGRMTLISMFGVLTEHQEQAISELMSARNDLGHNPWFMYDEDSEKRFKRTANRVAGIFDELAQDPETLKDVSENLMSKIED